MRVAYDPTVITLTGASTAGSRSDGMTVHTWQPAPGELRLGGFGAAPLSGNGPLVTLTGEARQPGETTLNLQAVRLNASGDGLTVIPGELRVIAAYQEAFPLWPEQDILGLVRMIGTRN